jgi:NAD(P)-dependent dehydrogenase (short-subunit alcohol dehydrogenase family)
MIVSKTIVITGASDGIGAAAARRLAALGHRVVVVGRSEQKSRAVADPLGAEWHTADFADLRSVRRLATELLAAHPRIDVLANNAGGVFGRRTMTADGFETTMQVNHVAPFLLTQLLLPRLVESEASVIQTSSIAARLYGDLDPDDMDNARRFSANKAYGDSKLANILFTVELQRRHSADGISAAAFHPGFIASGFAAETTSRAMRLVYDNPLARPFLSTPDRGAEQLVWLAQTQPNRDWTPGTYFERKRPAHRMNPQARDAALAAALWDATLARLRDAPRTPTEATADSLA